MDERTQRQHLGVQKWVDSGCRATLQYCTGFGKTSTALMCIARFVAKNPMRKIVVIVPTEQLKTQWITILDKKGYAFNIEVIIINTAIKSNFHCDLLILDEIHLYAAESFYRIFEVCKPHMILGLTATFERLDGKEKLIAQHCPVCDIITVKEATSKGWLATYTEYKVMLDVDLSEYHVVNAAFMNHFAFFDFRFEVAMG